MGSTGRTAWPGCREESQGRIDHLVRRVVLALERLVGPAGRWGPRSAGFGVAGHRRMIVQHHLLAVPPQIAGIVAVGVPLAVVAKEQIEALPVGVAARAEVAQPHLPMAAVA